MIDAISTAIRQSMDPLGRRGLPETITADDCLTHDLDMCQLDRLCLTCELEEQYSIEITDKQAEGWQTVGDILQTVEALK